MIRPNFFSTFFNSIDEIYHYKAIQKSILMSAGSPYGRIVSSILKKLSLGQLNIEHFNAQTQTLNSLPRNQRSQQENSTNPEDGHVWKDEWRTRGYSRWPLTNSQFGKFLLAYFNIFFKKFDTIVADVKNLTVIMVVIDFLLSPSASKFQQWTFSFLR